MKKTLLILLLLPILVASNAQRKVNVTAWLDVLQTDGNVVISSWCQNHSSSPQHLRYKAILIQKDSIVNEGKTLALPDQPNLLLNAGFLVKGGQFEQVQLFIYKGDELLASAQAIGPKPISPTNLEENQARSLSSERLNLDDIEIEGLVLDETRSKLAHDFYEMFYGSWRAIEEDLKTAYSIIVREQPSIGNGSRITVELNGTELTQLNLQPRIELLESLSMQLVELLYNQITNPDAGYQEIGVEDISGSGIY